MQSMGKEHQIQSGRQIRIGSLRAAHRLIKHTEHGCLYDRDRAFQQIDIILTCSQ